MKKMFENDDKELVDQYTYEINNELINVIVYKKYIMFGDREGELEFIIKQDNDILLSVDFGASINDDTKIHQIIDGEYCLYQLNNGYIYLDQEGKLVFTYLQFIEFNNEYDENLLGICKALVNTGMWEYFMDCTEYILKFDMEFIKGKVLKYSSNIFDEEDLELNEYSLYTRGNVYEYSNKMIEKYDFED